MSAAATSSMVYLLRDLEHYNKKATRLHRDLLYKVSPTSTPINEAFLSELERHCAERACEVEQVKNVLETLRVTQSEVELKLGREILTKAREALHLLEAVQLAAARRIYLERPSIERAFVERPLSHLGLLERLIETCSEDTKQKVAILRASCNTELDGNTLIDIWSVLSAYYLDSFSFVSTVRYWSLTADEFTHKRLDKLKLAVRRLRTSAALGLEYLNALEC